MSTTEQLDGVVECSGCHTEYKRLGFPAARVGLCSAILDRKSLALTGECHVDVKSKLGAKSFGGCRCARRATTPKQSLSGLFTSGTLITARRFVSPERAGQDRPEKLFRG